MWVSVCFGRSFQFFRRRRYTREIFSPFRLCSFVPFEGWREKEAKFLFIFNFHYLHLISTWTCTRNFPYAMLVRYKYIFPSTPHTFTSSENWFLTPLRNFAQRVVERTHLFFFHAGKGFGAWDTLYLLPPPQNACTLYEVAEWENCEKHSCCVVLFSSYQNIFFCKKSTIISNFSIFASVRFMHFSAGSFSPSRNEKIEFILVFFDLYRSFILCASFSQTALSRLTLPILFSRVRKKK